MDKTLPACPVETTLSLISDRWKVLIIRDLLGMSLRPVLDAMQSWGESYKEKRAGGETA